jgi:hypothetical protein
MAFKPQKQIQMETQARDDVAIKNLESSIAKIELWMDKAKTNVKHNHDDEKKDSQFNTDSPVTTDPTHRTEGQTPLSGVWATKVKLISSKYLRSFSSCYF